MKTKQAGFTCFGWNQFSIGSWQAHWSFFFLVEWQHCFLGESVLTNICRDHYIRSAAWECFVWDQSFSSSFQPRPFPPLLWRSPILRFSYKKKMLFALFKRYGIASTNPKLLGAREGIIQKNLKMRIAPITFTCLFACVPTFDCFQKTDFPQT